jgi:hypothetical protein
MRCPASCAESQILDINSLSQKGDKKAPGLQGIDRPGARIATGHEDEPAQYCSVSPSRQKEPLELLASLGGHTQFVSLVPAGTGSGPIWCECFGPGDQKVLDFVARSNAERRASYYALNEVQAGLTKKAAKADIVAARGLHVDVDPPSDGSPFDKYGALTQLRALPLQPSYIVDTGGGFQAIWLFNAPVHDLQLVEAINRRIAALTGGDHCHNIDRLLRVPGSLNTPTAKKAAVGRKPAWAQFVR